jgi:DNA-directed RNA polymerase II subunit RPB2
MNRNIGTPNIKLDFDNWNRIIEVKENCIFLPVTVKAKENCMIADITVENKNHCFFGGDGFGVHNSAMGKQALGVYMTNFNSRMDTISNILNYPQKALISTKLSKYTHAAELPSGINAVVAIMTYSGFNQEDGIIVNRDALDRGLFVSTHYKTLKEQCNKNGSTGEEEIFCRPEECDRNKQFNYGKLNKEGFVDKNTAIQSGDIVVGKIMPKKIKTKIHKIDTSIAIKSNEEGIVDYNYSEINNEGYAFCKIRIRNHRKPAVGDKLASSIAQKASIGMIYNQEDMPYTKDGIVPDLIMNPHAIPSRMTIAQLMECVLGKVACVEGVTKDCTPYNNLSVKEICDQLELYGMERHSNEILYDGYTGRQIKTEIFIGPTYYQRLKHMVVDKMHSRSSNGPIVFLTRQPSEGRSRCGGLRLGEMERDAIVAHGSSLFLKERILDCSDNSRQTICKTCGFIITSNPDKNLYQCTACKNELEPSQIRIPYSFKLLIQELQCMNIGIRMSI